MASGDARKAVDQLIEVDGVSDADSGDDGARSPRKVQDPKRPSEIEIAELELSHLPFRPQCNHSIRGRSEATLHARADRDDNGVPEVHMDYCFLGGQSEEAQPVLVLGAGHEDALELLGERERRECPARDTPSCGILQSWATVETTSSPGPTMSLQVGRWPRRSQPRGKMAGRSWSQSSGSSGIVERGVKEFEYHVRTMKSALDWGRNDRPFFFEANIRGFEYFF